MLLKGTQRILEIDHKELKGKIDHVNENIKTVAQVFEVEKSIFNETLGNQREYLESLQAGKLSKQSSSSFMPFSLRKVQMPVV